MEATSLRFAAAARVLGDEARRAGLRAPGFRSPPRVDGAARTIRRARGGASVAIVVRGRPWAAVLADMVDGLCVANGLRGADCAPVREAAWQALAGAGLADERAPESFTAPSPPDTRGFATIEASARVA